VPDKEEVVESTITGIQYAVPENWDYVQLPNLPFILPLPRNPHFRNPIVDQNFLEIGITSPSIKEELLSNSFIYFRLAWKMTKKELHKSIGEYAAFICETSIDRAKNTMQIKDSVQSSYFTFYDVKLPCHTKTAWDRHILFQYKQKWYAAFIDEEANIYTFERMKRAIYNIRPANE